MSQISQVYLRKLSCTYQGYLRHISNISQVYLIHFLSKYQAYLRPFLAISQAHISHISTISRNISTIFHHIEDIYSASIYRAVLMHISVSQVCLWYFFFRHISASLRHIFPAYSGSCIILNKHSMFFNNRAW